MPVRRDAHGNLIIEESRKIDSGGGRPDAPTEDTPSREAAPRNAGADPSSGSDPYEAKTIFVRSRKGGRTARQDTQADAKTKIYRPGAQAPRKPSETPGADARPGPASAMDDPPVGWLVVVNGPGQGNVLTVGNGSNSIGRERDERIRIDFGDETISRRGHAIVTYDPRGKKFYVQHGGGKNLTYLEDAPVLSPTELTDFSRILIGDTSLLFVPLCCERFDWEQAG